MAKNTIKLKKYLDVIEEYKATAVAITPGMLLELTSAGLVQAHSTEGGPVLTMIALEDEMQGKEISDNYAASDKIQCWVAVRGEVAYLPVADNETVDTGDFLISAGNGKVKVYGGSAASDVEWPSSLVGVALADLDMTDSVDAEVGYVAVRII
jgi:hypothetical protein